MTITCLKTLWKHVLGNNIMIRNLSAFYFLPTYLESIVVSSYFEDVIPEEESGEVPFGMYGLSNYFLSLYIIGSIENWTEILYNPQQYSPNITYTVITSITLIIWFIFSNLMILNIFIAVISQSIRVDENEKRFLQIRHYMKYVYPKNFRNSHMQL